MTTRASARQQVEESDEAGHGGDGEDGVSDDSAPDDDDVPQSGMHSRLMAVVLRHGIKCHA